MQVTATTAGRIKFELSEGEKITFSGYASTPERDENGHVVPLGFWTPAVLEGYLKNPVLLFNHERDAAVGLVTSAKVDDVGLYVEGYVARRWEGAWMVEAGIVKSLSVGITVDTSAVEYDETSDTLIFNAGALHEISLVTIPANRNAQIFLKSHKFNSMNLKDLQNAISTLATALGIENEGRKVEEIAKDLAGEIQKLVASLDEMKSAKASDDGEAMKEFKKSFESIAARLDEIAARVSDIESKTADLLTKAGPPTKNTAPPKPGSAQTDFARRLRAIVPDVESKY